MTPLCNYWLRASQFYAMHMHATQISLPNPHERSAAHFLHTQHPGHDVAPVRVVCMQKLYSEFKRIAASQTPYAISRLSGTVAIVAQAEHLFAQVEQQSSFARLFSQEDKFIYLPYCSTAFLSIPSYLPLRTASCCGAFIGY
eukprot:2568070-Karenia_brevis.AAC.1